MTTHSDATRTIEHTTAGPVASGRVVLLGATGRTGLALLERTAPAGVPVRAIVRNPARLQRFAAHPSVDISTVSIDDRESLDRSLAGCRAVVSAIGPRGLDPQGLYSATAEAIVQAMKRTGVRRLIFVTSSGHEPDPNFPLFFKAFVKPVVLKRIYADMSRAERVIENADVEWTIVRPSMFIRHDAQRSYRVRNRLNPEGGWKISREHTAEFIVDELRHTTWARQHPALAY